MRRINSHTEFIKRRVMEGKRVTEIHRELSAKFGERAPSYITVKKWASFYKAARDGREEEPGLYEESKIRKKFREIIKNGVDERKTPRAIHDELKKRFHKKAPCLATVFKWCYRIQYARDGISLDLAHASSSSNENEQVSSNVKPESIDGENLFKQDDTHLAMSLNHGFDLGLEPEKIEDFFIVDGERFFIVKWKNWLNRELGKFLLLLLSNAVILIILNINFHQRI